MKNYIYKFENKINGKIYIGQSIDPSQRFRGHKSDSFNDNSKAYDYPLPRAIRKYGIDNFDYEIIEEIPEDKPQEYVDERERYYIKYYHSLTTEYGYNVSSGGKNGPSRPKLTYEEILLNARYFTKEEILDIQQRLINDEDYEEIKKIYSPKLKASFLSNINNGINFHNPNFNYPLKKEHWKSRFTKEEVADIKDKIKKGVKYSDIQKEYDIKSTGFLSMVNTGKYYFDKEDTYPLYNKGCRKIDNEIWVNGIIKDILETNFTLVQIAKKWGKSYSTVKKINEGWSHRKKGLDYPLRKKR